MLSRQARIATGSLQGHVSRVASSSRRLSPVRFASSSSSSSSSSSTSTNRTPLIVGSVAVITSVAAYSIFSRSNQQPLSLEAPKRKEYWERMKIEEKKQQQQEEAETKDSRSESSSNNKSQPEEVASEATNDLAEQASQESAFDPETNTINWDCPCLGGMAHGPCGEDFKTAFSCFVFSEAEPKGIDCVEHFKGMQDCFRKHPEHYKDEIEDDEDFESQEAASSATSTSSLGDNEEEEDEGVREFRREMSKES